MGVKLGQKWAVKDGNLLASNQVGSRFFNKEFDFSRTSNGTYVDRDGLLKTAELYNLLSYSQDFSASTLLNTTLTDSQIDVNGQDDAYLLKDDSTSGEHYIILPAMSSTTNDYLTSSIYVKANGISKVQLWNYYLSNQLARVDFDLSNDTYSNGVYTNVPFISASIESLGNDWKRISITSYKPASSYAYKIRINLLDDGGNSSYSGEGNGVYIFGGQQVLGTEPLDYQYTNGLQGLPRISFEDGVGHLLLEPQRSNYINNDERLVAINAGQVDYDYAISPDGTQNAQLVTFGTTLNDGAVLGINTTLAISGNTEYTFSIYAKNISGDGEFNLRIDTDTTSSVFLKNFTATSEWQRLSATFTTDAGASLFGPNCRLRMKTANNKILFYGCQVEQGNYSTSLIKTEGTSVTRLADVCNNSGSAQDFNSEEGVLYAEMSALSDDSSYKVISISDQTNNNIVRIFYTNNSNEIKFDVKSNNIEVLNYVHNADITNFYKLALRYQENNFSAWINGTQVAINTSGSTPIGLKELKFNNGTNNYPFYGKTKNLQAFTEALSDAELQQLTT